MGKIPQAVPAQLRGTERKVGEPKRRKPAKHNSRHGSLAGKEQKTHSKGKPGNPDRGWQSTLRTAQPYKPRSYCELWRDSNSSSQWILHLEREPII